LRWEIALPSVDGNPRQESGGKGKKNSNVEGMTGKGESN